MHLRSTSSRKPMKLRPLHVVLIPVLATASTHIVCALRSNYIAAQGTVPHSAPWWFAWLLPAPVTVYLAIGSLVVAAGLLAVRYFSGHVRL